MISDLYSTYKDTNDSTLVDVDRKRKIKKQKKKTSIIFR